jgi:hypothetical protein
MATTRKRKGTLRKSIRVVTNDAKNPNPTLQCEGSVKVPFEMHPSMVSFSQVKRSDEAQRKTVKITRGDAGPLALELAPIAHKNIKAALREIEPGEKYELDVELVPPWPSRTVQAYLTLKTGVEQAPQEQIRVYARVAPRLASSPSRFTIPRNMRSDLDLKSRLIWSGGEPGKILEVTSSEESLTASYEEANNRQMIVLHVPKDYQVPTRARPFVTVKTDDQKAPLIRIQVYAAPQRPTGTPRNPTVRRLPRPPTAVSPGSPAKPARPKPQEPPKPTNDSPGAKEEPSQPAKKSPAPADKADADQE